MTPNAYCRQVCKKSGSNFVLTFYLFGPRRRRALQAFYAFCRLVDDAVDQAGPSDQTADRTKASAELQCWRKEVELLFEGRPRHVVCKALAPAVRDFKLKKKYFDEIIAGCEMDLTQKTYPTFEELEFYCYRVASCVGLICLKLFGVTVDGATERGAIALGKALQLTNILRDVAADLKRGRIYLPAEDLKKFGVGVEDLAARPKNLSVPNDSPALMELLYFEIERARAFFDTAWRAMPLFGREKRRMLAARLMGRFYEAILNKISRDPLVIFKEKVRLTAAEKIKISLGEIFS